MKTWCVRTCKGRVVYNRKLHPFSIKDAVRVGKKIPKLVVLSFDVEDIEILQWIARGAPADDLPPQFGGGEFGGGGASRGYSAETKSATDSEIEDADAFLFVNSSIIEV